MKNKYTLEYWIDDNWYVGRIIEIPGLFSQGETLDELEENINDAYRLLIKEIDTIKIPNIKKKQITVEI